MELNYRKAVQDDAELLIEMYNAAFHADYIRYGGMPGVWEDEGSNGIIHCRISQIHYFE